ncbi:MAG: DUF4907 domain-containing protein [Bacteroidota bacterium]
MKSLLVFMSVLFLSGILSLIYLELSSKKKTKKHSYRYEVIALDEGFGYEIFIENKLIIKQNFIPAVPGEKPFLTAKNAQLIAELVVEKLSKGKSPVIDIKEIDNIYK